MAGKDIDVGYVAALARVALDDEAKARLQGDIESILEYMDKLGELDVEGIEPTAHATVLSNVWREDQAAPSFPQDTMLANAPDTIDDELVAVPPVLPGEEMS